MKKTYQNPALEVVKIQMVGMLAASVGFGEGQKDGSLAAGRSFDFDEEED